MTGTIRPMIQRNPPCPRPDLRTLARWAVVTVGMAMAAGCASLPDSQALLRRHEGQAVQFENARGALSARRNAMILANLQRQSGDIDILEKQIALEEC